MNKTIENKITAAGSSDLPEPVGGASFIVYDGAGLGLPRSSPSDDPRRESESPNKKELQHSRLNFFSQMQRCNSVSGQKKRKVIDTSLNESLQDAINLVEDPIAFTIREPIKTLTNLCRNLGKVVEANNNTKKEIKDITERIKRQIDALNTDTAKKWLKEHKFQKPEIPKYNVDTQVNIKVGLKDQETQTKVWNVNNETISLECIENFEDWQKVKLREIPANKYRNTEVKIGNPLDTKDVVTKVVIVEPNDKEMQQSIQRLYKDRYPAIMPPNRKELQTMEIETTVKIDGETNTALQKIIRAEYDGTEKGIWDKIIQIKNIVKDENWVAFHHVNSMELNTFQKMLEVVFHQTQTQVVIYTTNKKKLESHKPALLIKPEKSTYAMILDKKGEDAKTILKTIKQKLTNSEEANTIQSIRETKNKKLIIITNKNSEEFQKLKQKITNDLPDIHVSKAGENRNRENIFIRGLEPDACKEEVLEVLKTKLGNLQQKEVIVSELRPNQNGTKSVTITVDKEDADKIMENELRIGLSTCSTERDLHIKRCYKCWAIDHIAKNCLGPDRRNSCHKCGKEGHRASDCNEASYCVLCQETGHQTGRGKCKTFRRAMSRTRRQQSTTVEAKDKIN